MYKIIAKSKWGTETVDTAKTEREAQFLVSEYQMAYGPSFTIYYK